MSRARRPRPDVRSAVRSAASRGEARSAARTAAAGGGATGTPSAAPEDRLAFLLDSRETPASESAPAAEPSTAAAAECSTARAAPLAIEPTIEIAPHDVDDDVDSPADPPPLDPPPPSKSAEFPAASSSATSAASPATPRNAAPATPTATVAATGLWSAPPAPRYRGDRDEPPCSNADARPARWTSALGDLAALALALPVLGAAWFTLGAARTARALSQGAMAMALRPRSTHAPE